MPYLTNPSREDKRKQANKQQQQQQQQQRIITWSSSANDHYLDGLYFIQVRHVAHKYEAIGNYSTEVTLEC